MKELKVGPRTVLTVSTVQYSTVGPTTKYEPLFLLLSESLICWLLLAHEIVEPSVLLSYTFSTNNRPYTISAFPLCFSCSLSLSPSGLAAHVLASGITDLVLNSRVVPPQSLQLLCWLNPIKGPETTHPVRCCFLWWGEGRGAARGGQ